MCECATCMRCIGGAGKDLFEALSKILVYCNVTREYRLKFGPGLDTAVRSSVIQHSSLTIDPWETFALYVLTDATFGGSRPMASFIIYAGGGAVGWRMAKLGVTAMSTCEAEYHSASRAARCAEALLPVIEFLNMQVKRPVILLCDNKATCMLSEGNISSSRLRHVATHLAFLRELAEEGKIVLLHIGTDGNIADIGTKPIAARHFHELRAMLVDR